MYTWKHFITDNNPAHNIHCTFCVSIKDLRGSQTPLTIPEQSLPLLFKATGIHSQYLCWTALAGHLLFSPKGQNEITQAFVTANMFYLQVFSRLFKYGHKMFCNAPIRTCQIQLEENCTVWSEEGQRRQLWPPLMCSAICNKENVEISKRDKYMMYIFFFYTGYKLMGLG